MIYRLTWLLLRALFKVLFRYEIHDAENVPKEGAVILASNHVSNLDPPVVGIGTWRPGYYMAKEELFRNKAFAWYITRLYAFPVKRGGADRASLKRALDLLAEGKMLVLFPEGTRSETGELKEPELGVGMIAYRSGAPVVPVYVAGTAQAMSRSGKIRRARISVTFGRPIAFAAAEGAKPGREEYQAAAHRIMAAIAALRDA